jgi:PAS domain S-box-containing protein
MMRRPWRVVAPLTLLLLAADLISGFTSHHNGGPRFFAVATGVAGTAFVVAGLLAWGRALGVAIGQVLVFVGLVWLLFAAFWSANDQLLYTIGNGFGSIPIAALLYLVAVYPIGRPTTRVERLLVLVLFPTAVLANLLPVLFQAHFSFDCPGCYQNRFLVADEPAVYHGLEYFFTVVGVVFFFAVVLLAILRWHSATPAMRRVLIPVYLTGGIAVASVGVGFAVGLASGTAGTVFWSIGFVGVVALPFAVIAGLVRSKLMLGLRQLLDYADVPTTAEAQDAIRRALGDPTTRVGYWLESAEGYVDVYGDPFPAQPEGPGRMITPIDSASGSPLGLIEHDATLATHEPDVLAQVVTAVRFALEKDRGRLALQASETRSRALLAASPDLMIRFRADGTYLDIEGDTAGLVRTPEEMIGRRIDDFLPAGAVEPLMRSARRALEQGTMETVEYELEVGGQVRTFEARMVPSGDDELISIVRDFTERRRLEAELELRLDELRRSRARIVEAQDGERRRLERNLHDGAQQRLVSISLALRLAQAQLQPDSEGARTILMGAGEELALALEELRELARGIHPAILTDRGLAAALQSLADRVPLEVSLEAVPEGRLPAPVEAAAFYVVSESLTNVTKYAQATLARVSVTRMNGRAVVEVVDDGVGGADPLQGSGLRGLADRVEALDGQLEVTSAPGAGTHVRAEIPLRLR